MRSRAANRSPQTPSTPEHDPQPHTATRTVSSGRLQRTSCPVTSITDRGGHPFRGEEKAVSEPVKLVRACRAIEGLAYSQNVFDYNASKSFVATKGSIAAQELSVYPEMNAIARPLFCLLYQEDLEPSLG